MNNDKRDATEAAELRRRAEELLRAKTAEARPRRSEADTQRLTHELEVHQIELVMQNAELLKSRDDAEAALEKYSDLYDFAPVGYFTLDRDGVIRGVNLTGASLLGIERARLIGRRLVSFLAPEYRPAFIPCLGAAFENRGRETCEVALQKAGNAQLYVQIEAVAEASGQECRIALIDITGRMRAEEAQARLAALVESSDDAIIAKNLNGIILSWNKGAERLFGYRADEIIGKSITLLLPSELQEEEGQILRRLAAGERIEHFETVRLTKAGRRVEVSVTASPIMDRQGRIIGASKIARDITDRKLAEETIRKSEKRYRSLFENMLEGFAYCKMLFDEHGRPVDFVYLAVNSAFERLTGLTNVVGKRVTEAIPGIKEAHPDLFEIYGRVALTGRPVTFELEFKPLGVLLSISVYSPERESFVAVFDDITARKRAEGVLRESERRYSSLFNNRYVTMFLIDPETGNILNANPAACTFYGYSSEQFASLKISDINTLPQPDILERMAQALNKETSPFHFRHRLANGEIRDVEVYSGPIEINERRLLYSIVHDVTERREMEEKLEILNSDLAAHAAELEAANIELEAFNFSVTHDLRRPLTNINGYCQVVMQLYGDKFDEQCKGYFQEIYEGTLRMNRLIDTLLGFSRVTRVEMRRETIDLGAMAKVVAAELSLAEPERRVTFRIAEGITAEGDAGLWRIVLDNLIGNAWKYTRIREETVIEFGMTEAEGTQTCFVRDNGPGFDMAFADKLFMPFQRLPGTSVEGYGIGLATVERIVRRHGGRIWAESEPGKGATFYFTLPSSLH